MAPASPPIVVSAHPANELPTSPSVVRPGSEGPLLRGAA